VEAHTESTKGVPSHHSLRKGLPDEYGWPSASSKTKNSVGGGVFEADEGRHEMGSWGKVGKWEVRSSTGLKGINGANHDKKSRRSERERGAARIQPVNPGLFRYFIKQNWRQEQGTETRISQFSRNRIP